MATNDIPKADRILRVVMEGDTPDPGGRQLLLYAAVELLRRPAHDWMTQILVGRYVENHSLALLSGMFSRELLVHCNAVDLTEEILGSIKREAKQVLLALHTRLTDAASIDFTRLAREVFPDGDPVRAAAGNDLEEVVRDAFIGLPLTVQKALKGRGVSQLVPLISSVTKGDPCDYEKGVLHREVAQFFEIETARR